MVDTVHDGLVVGGGLVGPTAALVLRHHGCAAQLPLCQPGADGEPVEVSPESPCLIAQDVLEPVLRAAAVDAGADVRFGTALTSIQQTTDMVVATLFDGELRARHVIATDGARSGIRNALGIGRNGRGAIGEPSVNVYFHADLADVVRGREFNLCLLDAGGLASVDGRTRWDLMVTGDDTDRDWPAVVRTALGVPAPDLEILSVLPWQAEMLVADRYSAGRVHLAGDVHNLGWKIAAVLRGEASGALLDTYDVERRPAGWFAADQSARRAENVSLTSVDPTLAHPFVLAAGGLQYTAGALVPDGTTGAGDGVRARGTGRHPCPAPRARRRPLDARPGRTGLGRAVRRGLPGRGERALPRPDHVVAWRGTGDPEPVRKALLGGRLPVVAAVSG